MTATTSAPGATETTVVACAADLSVDGLRAALHTRTCGVDVRWDVIPTAQLPAGCTPPIAVCDAAGVGAVARRWPACVVVAVVAAHDDGVEVISALQAGAATCVRGKDLSIAAAFIVAVARRGDLIPEDPR